MYENSVNEKCSGIYFRTKSRRKLLTLRLKQKSTLYEISKIHKKFKRTKNTFADCIMYNILQHDHKVSDTFPVSSLGLLVTSNQQVTAWLEIMSFHFKNCDFLAKLRVNKMEQFPSDFTCTVTFVHLYQLTSSDMTSDHVVSLENL